MTTKLNVALPNVTGIKSSVSRCGSSFLPFDISRAIKWRTMPWKTDALCLLFAPFDSSPEDTVQSSASFRLPSFSHLALPFIPFFHSRRLPFFTASNRLLKFMEHRLSGRYCPTVSPRSRVATPEASMRRVSLNFFFSFSLPFRENF